MDKLERNHSIDILKFICAVLVVFLHVNTPFSEYYLPITRCAVPCFFIISGYMIYRVNGIEQSLKRSIKNIFVIVIWSSILYGIVKFIYAFRYDNFVFLSWKSLIYFIFLNENPFSFHLWYLNAYLYTLIVILICHRLNILRYVYLFIPVLLSIDLIFGKYSLLIFGKVYNYLFLRNFLFVGIPYFMIGFVIKQHKDNIFQIKNIRLYSFFCIIVFIATSLIEKYLLVLNNINALRDHYLSSTFLAISLFVFFISKDEKKSNILSDMGKKDSLYIYIFHPLSMLIFSYIIFRMPELLKKCYSYIAPIVIIISTLILIKILRACGILK